MVMIHEGCIYFYICCTWWMMCWSWLFQHWNNVAVMNGWCYTPCSGALGSLSKSEFVRLFVSTIKNWENGEIFCQPSSKVCRSSVGPNNTSVQTEISQHLSERIAMKISNDIRNNIVWVLLTLLFSWLFSCSGQNVHLLHPMKHVD